jgi:hypothetical protein
LFCWDRLLCAAQASTHNLSLPSADTTGIQHHAQFRMALLFCNLLRFIAGLSMWESWYVFHGYILLEVIRVFQKWYIIIIIMVLFVVFFRWWF